MGCLRQFEESSTMIISFSLHTPLFLLYRITTQIETPEVGAEFEVYLKSSGSYANAVETERDYLTCDENGYFKTKEYVCGNYTVQEILPSEGYLLDKTVYSVGAEAENYFIEHNPLSMTVTEDVIKGNIAMIKHSDDGSMVLSISLDTFYSNKNYATRKI